MRSAERTTWRNMLTRCGDPKNCNYHRYGARGITVCSRWQSFDLFLADVGPRPSPTHSLDRIDNNGNYEPGNVRWATRRVQLNNTRRNRYVTISGETRSLTEWARHYGVRPTTADARLRGGCPPEEAFTRTPDIRGERNASAKLTASQVVAVIARHASGESYTDIARDLGVSRPTITGICLGTKWKHMTARNVDDCRALAVVMEDR